MSITKHLNNILKKSEKYTKTDMTYLISGGFWISLNKGLSIITGLATSIVFANFLPKEVYGTYKFAIAAIGIIYIFSLGGLNTALKRAVARGKDGDIMAVLKTKMKWSLLGSLTCIALAGYYFFQDNTTLGTIFLAMSFIVPLNGSFDITKSILQGKKFFRLDTTVSFFRQIFFAVAIIAIVLFTKNAVIITIAHFAFTTILQSSVLLYIFRNIKLSKTKETETISYGKYLSGLNVFSTISSHIDKLLLWYFLGATDLAIYMFAIAPTTFMNSFFAQIRTMAFPKFAKQQLSTLQKSLPKKLALFFVAIIVPVIILYIIVAPFFFHLLYPLYTGAILYSQIYALRLSNQPALIINSALRSTMRKKRTGLISLFNPTTNILLLVLLIPPFGIMGAIVARVLASAMNSVFSFLVFRFTKNES